MYKIKQGYKDLSQLKFEKDKDDKKEDKTQHL